MKIFLIRLFKRKLPSPCFPSNWWLTRSDDGACYLNGDALHCRGRIPLLAQAPKTFPPHPSPPQSIARGLFQLSRQDREFLPFSLKLRDKIENFFLSVSCFETRSRISSFQSHASRRDREFLSLGLVLRDENENLILQSHVSRQERDFFSSVSCFETRTRIFTFSLMHRDENENFYFQSHSSRREYLS